MSSHSDPEALVAAVIADLPTEFGEFTRRDLAAMHRLGGTLLFQARRAIGDECALIDRLDERFTYDGQPLREVATEDEIDELEAAMRRSLAVERAQAALNAFQRRIGVPWEVPEPAVSITEDLDDELVGLLP